MLTDMAEAMHGKDKIKVYTTKFTNLYHGLSFINTVYIHSNDTWPILSDYGAKNDDVYETSLPATDRKG